MRIVGFDHQNLTDRRIYPRAGKGGISSNMYTADRLSLTAELSEQKADDKFNQGKRSEAKELRLTTGLFFSFCSS